MFGCYSICHESRPFAWQHGKKLIIVVDEQGSIIAQLKADMDVMNARYAKLSSKMKSQKKHTSEAKQLRAELEVKRKSNKLNLQCLEQAMQDRQDATMYETIHERAQRMGNELYSGHPTAQGVEDQGVAMEINEEVSMGPTSVKRAHDEKWCQLHTQA